MGDDDGQEGRGKNSPIGGNPRKKFASPGRWTPIRVGLPCAGATTENRYCTRWRIDGEGTYLPPPSYRVLISPPFAAAEEGAATKEEGRRRTKTTTATMMTKKMKRTKNRENRDPCDNPYRISRWSTAVGRVSRCQDGSGRSRSWIKGHSVRILQPGV